MTTPSPHPSRTAILLGDLERVIVAGMIVYAVVDDSLSDSSPLGDAIETFVRREDAERFVAEVRGDDPELAA